MSSLVHKKRQQAVGAEREGPPVDQHDNTSCQKPPNSATLANIAKKGLQKRSVSFEKLMVTACHIRLACSKCSREALKLCLELLILRSRIMAQQLIAVMLANLLHLSHEWNNKFLDIANAIIPKWQNRARHIVDATIVQRQWRRQREMKTATTTNNNSDASPAVENKNVIRRRSEVEEKGAEIKVAHNHNVPTLMDKSEEQLKTEELIVHAKERYTRQRLTLAVTVCAIILGMQVMLGFALLVQSIHKTPWELYFLVMCVAYIGYLLQSIFNYDRITRTTCNFGGTKSPTRVSKVSFRNEPKEQGGADVEVAKVIHLSFIERTMSKVKLL